MEYLKDAKVKILVNRLGRARGVCGAYGRVEDWMLASFLRTRGQGARVSVEGFEGSTDPVARSDGRLWDRGRDHARGQAFLTASSRLR